MDDKLSEKIATIALENHLKTNYNKLISLYLDNSYINNEVVSKAFTKSILNVLLLKRRENVEIRNSEFIHFVLFKMQDKDQYIRMNIYSLIDKYHIHF